MHGWQPGLLSLCLLTGCSGVQSGPEPEVKITITEPVTGGSWYQPAVAVTWQWQLLITDPDTELNTSYDVEIYDVDLFDVSASDIAALKTATRKVICYFSAGSWEDWRDDADDFPSAVLGNTLDGWDDEKWLDIRAQSVKTIMDERLQLAVDKGCDGVEPDNMDGYQNNPGFALQYNDQINYNRYIANKAHTLGLSVALKNDLDQIEDLVDYFDFSVNEECFEYEECEMLNPFIDAGKPVLNAEYADKFVNNTGGARTAMCSEANSAGLSSLVLPLDLDDSFRVSCF
jgi:hypothetical protein